MTILIAGGGTGGHIFPALALAERLRERFPGDQIRFVGSRHGLEKELIPKHGYPLHFLPIRGFLGKSARARLAMLWRVPASLWLSLCLLLRYRPRVVVGVGGYASGPLLWMAALLRFPTMIQEQNAFPGVTNRMLSRWVDLACCGFAEAARQLRCMSLISGNPIRSGFGKIAPWTADRTIILVLGGSQGARSLNQILPALLRGLPLAEAGMEVVHQCGSGHEEMVKAEYLGAAFKWRVLPFIDDVPQMLGQTRLVICRSGASTVSELKMARIPAVLIPFPRATHDHQTYNAKSLALLGAAILIPESQLREAEAQLMALVKEPHRLAAMARAYPAPAADSGDLIAMVAVALAARRPKGEILEEFKAYVS